MVNRKEQFLQENQGDVEKLAKKFAAYPTNISKIEIRSFLSLFDAGDMAVALKLLKNIDYYDMSRMTNVTRSLGERVTAINNDTLDDVLFCPMSRTSGNSSDSIQRLLKLTHGGSTARSRQEFKMKCMNNVLDMQKLYTSQDVRKVVFIDHFIGSGDYIVRTWGGVKQWRNDKHEYFVGVLVAYTDSIDFVEQETDQHLTVIPAIELPPTARAFHTRNPIFTDKEKKTLMKYCDKLGIEKEHKYGFNNSQSLVVFSNRVSDNVLPILWYETEKWKPIFPRIFQ